MNPIAIKNFFHIIYNVIFISLFGINQIAIEFFESILKNFTIVETNGHGILHLYCLV